MLENLESSKEFRHGFVEESIRARITAQITRLRKARGWDLKTFASEIGKKVSWAYRLEDPNSAIPTVPSLLEVAEAFDVALDVRFRAFSESLDDVTTLHAESFTVPPFEAELRSGAFRERPRRNRAFRKGLKLVLRRPSKSAGGDAGIRFSNPGKGALAKAIIRS